MTTLSEMWDRYNLLYKFKIELNKRGYVADKLKDIYCIQVQLYLLKKLIESESINVLDDLLKKKTYCRLLRNINKGIEYLPDIIENPELYVLNPIEKDKKAWSGKNVLVFTVKNGDYAFSKISRLNEGFKYIDGKWQ